MVLEEELRVAEKAARMAGQIAKELAHNHYVNFKPNNEGPVTNADYAADLKIREILKQAFPKDEIITEESFPQNTSVPNKGRIWFVDPIDGTSYFIKGEDDYVVMIGLVVDQEPVLGVLFQPATGILWRAIDTRRCLSHFEPFFMAQKQKTETSNPINLDIAHKYFDQSSPIAVASRQHPSQFINFLTAELKVAHVIRKGSVGLKLALIADETADFYITSAKRIKLWDTCAPYVILTAAGGFMKSIEGENLRFFGSIEHGCEIYAANLHCEQWLLKELPSAIKKWKQHLTSIRKML